MFMFDAYEIVCWINFVDRFNFFNFCYDVNDAEQVINSTCSNILYIGAATKCITNDDADLKDQIMFKVFGPTGLKTFDRFRIQYGHHFDEHKSSIFLKNHKIMQKLEVGFEREFNSDLDLPDVAERLTTADGIAKQLKLIQEQVKTYENAKNDLNVIVDNICS